MNYSVEYQRGPLHIGKTVMTLRSYAWDDEQIENYIKMRREEGFELLVSVDESLKDAMDALGGDLEKYLEEAGESVRKDVKKMTTPTKVQQEHLASPFISVFKGFGDLFGSLAGVNSGPRVKTIICQKCNTENKKGTAYCEKCGTMLRKPTKEELFTWANSKKAATKDAKYFLYWVYKNYKKAHGFLSW